MTTRNVVAVAGLAMVAGGAIGCTPSKAAEPPVVKSSHAATRILNQGPTNGCSGFSVAGLLGKSNKDGLRIYALATKLDNLPGSYATHDDRGSRISDALTAAKQLHYISGFKTIKSANVAIATGKSRRLIVSLWDWPDAGEGHAMILLSIRGGVAKFQSSWGTARPEDFSSFEGVLAWDRGTLTMPVSEVRKRFLDAATVNGVS